MSGGREVKSDVVIDVIIREGSTIRKVKRECENERGPTWDAY